MIQARQKESTTYDLVFLMVSSTDHVTAKTGLTPSVTLSKNGGAFASAAGAVSEIGSGWYKLAGNATDRDTLGSLAVHASASGADPCDLLVMITDYDPFAMNWNSGTGLVEWSCPPIKDNNGNLLEGVTVWITADEDGETRLAIGTTDETGTITFHLSLGTVYVWCEKTGYMFNNPSTEVVA